MNAKNQLKLYNSNVSSMQKGKNNNKFYKIKFVYIKNINDKKKYMNIIYKNNKLLNNTDINSNTDAETIININTKLNKNALNNLTASQQIIMNKKTHDKILSEEDFNNNLKNKQFTPKTQHKNSTNNLKDEFYKTHYNSLEDNNKIIYASYNEGDLIKKLSSIKLDKCYINNKTNVDLTELCGSDRRGNISHNLRLFQMRTFDGVLDLNANKSKIKAYKTLSNSVKNNVLNRNKQTLSKKIFNVNNINNYLCKNEINGINIVESKKQLNKNNIPFYKITNVYSSDTNQNIELNDFDKNNKNVTPVENLKRHNKNSVCEEVAQKRPGRHINTINKTENEELNDEEENNNQNDAKIPRKNNNFLYKKLETFANLNPNILNKMDSNMNKTNIKNQITKINVRKNSCNEYMENSRKCKINKYLSILKKMQDSKKLSSISKNFLNKTSRKTFTQENKPKQNTININIHNCNNDNYNCFLINIDKDEKSENFIKNFKKNTITHISENSSKSKSRNKEKRRHNYSNKDYQQTNIRQKKIKQNICLETKLLKSPYSQIKKNFKKKTKLNPLKMSLLKNGIRNFGYGEKINDEYFNYNYQVDENVINNNMNNTNYCTNSNYCTINNNRKTNDFLQKKIKDILLKKAINTEYGKKTKHKRLGNMVFIDYKQNKKSTVTLNNTDNN